MYKYKEMLKLAQSKGFADEKKMWKCVESLDPILDMVAMEHPEEFDEWMVKQHEIMFGPHFNHEIASDSLNEIFYTDKNGVRKFGPHWTSEEILDATKNFKFPEGTTDDDKWVAFNVWYADLNRDMPDDMIIRTAHRFFFNDEDAAEGKIWRYMNM